MLVHPRIEVHIDSSIALFQHAPPTRLLQLALQDPISAIGLLLESFICIIVFRRVVVAEPVALACHRTERADKEEDPFLKIDSLLLAGASTEFAGAVVDAEEVIDHCSRLPGHDAGVGVLQCWDLSRLSANEATVGMVCCPLLYRFH